MNRINELRKQNKYSQQKLAAVLNVHQTAISQWETERTTPDIELAAKMANLFGVSIEYLLGKSNEGSAPNVSADYLLGRTSKGSHSPNFSKRELELIQKYRDNPKMQPAVNMLLGITTEESEDVYEIPVAARSGKNGMATSSFSEEERRAALESEFPGVFEETE